MTMNGIGMLVLLFLASKAQKPGLVPASTTRTAVKGKSGRTWFALDSHKAKDGALVPIRSLFATATGQDLVLSFAVMPGGVRAWTFKSPSSLTATAMKDFDVQDFRAAV